MNESKFNGLSGCGNVSTGKSKRPKPPKKPKPPPLEKYDSYRVISEPLSFPVVRILPNSLYGVGQIRSFSTWLNQVANYEEDLINYRKALTLYKKRLRECEK